MPYPLQLYALYRTCQIMETFLSAASFSVPFRSHHFLLPKWHLTFVGHCGASVGLPCFANAFFRRLLWVRRGFMVNETLRGFCRRVSEIYQLAMKKG